MTHELTHTGTGETLIRLMDKGWNVLQDPVGGGHNDVRCTGGWWLYKGDEAQARAEQEQRMQELRPRIDRFWAHHYT